MRRILCVLALLVGCFDSDGSDRLDRDVALWPLPPVTGPQLMRPLAHMREPDAAMPDAIELGPDVFDPDQVYVLGKFEDGACTRRAVSSTEQPSIPRIAFTCQVRDPQIRPTDGSLIYADTGSAREGLSIYHLDGFDEPDAGTQDPTANDGVIPTPMCSGMGSALRFRIAPNGRIYYSCGDDWWDDNGDLVPKVPMATLLFGDSDTVLTDVGITDLKTGESHPFVSLPPGQHFAPRARHDGYWIVVLGIAASIDQPELWHVGFDGRAALLGVYPMTAWNHSPAQSALDGHGRLIQTVIDAIGSHPNTIVRRSIDGESALIYNDGAVPFTVKLEGSLLFSGP